jgi:DnaJ-class molecular chaperone
MQTPPATADASTERPCFWCNGSGRVPNDDEQRYDDCSVCEGTGSRSAAQLVERIAA